MFNGEEVAIVLVEWTDSEAMPGWHEERDIQDYIERPLTVMISVGWLLHDCDDWVILAQSIDKDQIEGFKAGEMIKIPRRLIRNSSLVKVVADIGKIDGREARYKPDAERQEMLDGLAAMEKK